jgi:NADPH:quinone reductase-like Zn-dependent oxidoreductase
MIKAVSYRRFGGPEVLEMVELPDPHAGRHQIRVEVHAAGINATEWKQRRGLLGGDLPQTTGRDVAGVVDEIGAGVEDVTVGVRVSGLSDDGAGAAELALLSHYAPVPPSLGFVEAAALPVARGRG